MAAPIEDYAMLGDGRTAALVCKSGSIDWLCWPRFDSNSCFGKLVGDDTNGYWSMSPVDDHRITRRYQKDTLILETDFETDSGIVRIIDFMPAKAMHSSVIRLVVGLSGSVAVRMELSPRFNYGAVSPWFETHPSGFIGAVGPDQILIYGAKKLKYAEHCVTAEFTVTTDERIPFVLTHWL